MFGGAINSSTKVLPSAQTAITFQHLFEGKTFKLIHSHVAVVAQNKNLSNSMASRSESSKS